MTKPTGQKYTTIETYVGMTDDEGDWIDADKMLRNSMDVDDNFDLLTSGVFIDATGVPTPYHVVAWYN